MTYLYPTHRAQLVFHAALIFCAACSGQASGEHGIAPPEAIPESIALSGGTVTVGFAGGRIREPVQLEPYQIMKYPVTRAQYDECVAAGACELVTEPSCSMRTFARFDMTSPDAPAVCTGYDNAVDYCHWIGGELPTLAEWLYAARGPQPQRYPWGNQPATCEQHPLAMQPAEGRLPATSVRIPCSGGAELPVLRVGVAHEQVDDGEMSDALLTPAELLRSDDRLSGAMCGRGVGDCIVYGRSAGAIDSVSRIQTGFPHSFRCTAGEE